MKPTTEGIHSEQFHCCLGHTDAEFVGKSLTDLIILVFSIQEDVKIFQGLLSLFPTLAS